MKKIIALVLSAVLILGSVIPAFAIKIPSMKVKYPCIYIHGNAGAIVDADGNQVYNFDPTTEEILAICKNVLPKLAAGLATGNLESYYDSFEEEFLKLYDKCSLDKDGNPKYGTHEAQGSIDSTETSRHSNYYDNGYNFCDYTFAPDWRLDPLYNADRMDAYIDDILEAAGTDKVCLASDCLGSVNILAYLGKYGHDKLYAVGMVDPVGFGCELVEDLFSGNCNIDANEVERFVNDKFIETVLPSDIGTVLEFLRVSVELANETGILKGFSDAFMKGLYDKLKDELVPRLTMASYGTWPSYWGLISAGKYQQTREFIFGSPESERYQEFSGLITKLDEYDRVVRQRIPELLLSAKEDGVKVGIVAKYGFQFPCILGSADRQCDVWVSLNYATLGATCAPIGETLSDEYIAEREALGYGKYISPDRIVDMSTCLLKDNTWIIKNRIHNQGSLENQILMNLFAGENINIDNSIAPQFLVHNDATGECEAMTEENCHTESWYTEPVEQKGVLAGLFARIKEFFEKIRRWFALLPELLGLIGK